MANNFQLAGAVDCVSVTPRFDFTGTVKVYVEDIYVDDLTTGGEKAVSAGTFKIQWHKNKNEPPNSIRA